MPPTLVVVGGGRMGEALVTGVLRSGWAGASDVVVVEKDSSRRKSLRAGLAGEHPGLTVTDRPPPADGAIVAVKPTDVREACAELATAGVRKVLSVAAGVRIEHLEHWLGDGVVVVRAMPNTAALVGASASAVCASASATPADVEWASEVLRSVGSVTAVPEGLLDAVTGLSGSGPAYVFLLAEALVDAGVLSGLDREAARQLSVQTLLGAARLLSETGDGPEALRAAVTSPGGTTAWGLRSLEAGGFRRAVCDAVVSATERAHQLGARPPV